MTKFNDIELSDNELEKVNGGTGVTPAYPVGTKFVSDIGICQTVIEIIGFDPDSALPYETEVYTIVNGVENRNESIKWTDITTFESLASMPDVSIVYPN